MHCPKGGPLETLWGEAGTYLKKSCKRKLREKSHAQRVAQNPPAAANFSNGPSLR